MVFVMVIVIVMVLKAFLLNCVFGSWPFPSSFCPILITSPGSNTFPRTKLSRSGGRDFASAFQGCFNCLGGNPQWIRVGLLRPLLLLWRIWPNYWWSGILKHRHYVLLFYLYSLSAATERWGFFLIGSRKSVCLTSDYCGWWRLVGSRSLRGSPFFQRLGRDSKYPSRPASFRRPMLRLSSILPLRPSHNYMLQVTVQKLNKVSDRGLAPLFWCCLDSSHSSYIHSEIMTLCCFRHPTTFLEWLIIPCCLDWCP